MRNLKFAFSLLFCLFIFSASVFACTCAPDITIKGQKESPVESAKKSAEIVFSGEVVAVSDEEDSSGKYITYRFEADKFWKGTIEAVVIIRQFTGKTPCPVRRFTENQKYLVYADQREDGTFRVSYCSRTTSFENADRDLKILGEGEKVDKKDSK